jgi:hypothetical protein
VYLYHFGSGGRRGSAPTLRVLEHGRRLSRGPQFPRFLPSPPRPPTSRGGRGAKRTPQNPTISPCGFPGSIPRVLAIGTPSRRRHQWGSGRRSSSSHLPPAKMTEGGAAALQRGGRGRLRRRRRGRSFRQRAARGKSRAARAARGEAAAAARNPRLRTP